MKKLLYLILSFATAAVGHCGTLDKTIGLTNFLFDSNHFQQVSQFHVQSYFVDNFRVTKGNTDLWFQPTWQNFKFDDVLTNAKANGVFNIWRFQGAFDWQGVQGKQNKVNPVRDIDDPLQQSSWRELGTVAKQVAIRYADDSQAYLSQAKVHRSTEYQNNTPKAGLGLLGAMEFQNEFDFLMQWSGATRTFTPEMGAVGFKVFMDSIRSVSKTMQIIMGGTIQPKVETMTRFIGKLKELYWAEGKQMPVDWYLNFHWYMRNGSNNQGAGTWGITPEQAGAYRFGKQLDSLCRVYGLKGWYCTETGWSTATGTTNVSIVKQNAPVLQGYDIYHSQGICMVRLGLEWAATDYCAGITFWNRKDNDDVGAYANGGVNYADWTPKICQEVISGYQTAYRNHDITNYRTNGTLYAVDLIASTDTTTLVWTDQNISGEYDAKPRLGKLVVTTPPQPDPPPQTVTLKVQYSTSAGHISPIDLKDGATIAPGAYYVFAEPQGLTTPVIFTLTQNGTVVVNAHPENGYPYDMTGGPSYNFTAGTYSLKVTSGAQTIVTAFTVGTIPPPVTKEPVTEIWYDTGKMYFKTANRTVSIPVP